MTIPLDQPPVDGGAGTGTAGSDEADYRTIETGSAGANSPVQKIHMQLDALDGMARDVIEGFKALPRRGIEVGGLLLGRIDAARPGKGAHIWVERFQRIACEHKFGPQFVLNREDQIRFEEAAARIAEAGELTVLGAYRSHTRPGFQLEESDQQFVDRYFGDPSDLVLLIKPESSVELRAQFFTRAAHGKLEPTGPEFPFQGRMLGMFAPLEPAPPSEVEPEEDEAPTGRPGLRNAEVESSFPQESVLPQEEKPVQIAAEKTPENSGGNTPAVAKLDVPQDSREEVPPASGPPLPVEPAGSSPEPPRLKSPRLVPDFVPAGDSPNPRTMFRSLDTLREQEEPRLRPEVHEEPEKEGFLKQWWPLLCAVVLVLGAVVVLFWPGKGESNNPARAVGTASAGSGSAEPFRPLGLYVDPSGQDWRITWNQTATPLMNARAVGLFVREGDDQNRIDLSPEDLKSGSYQYKPKSPDVTFRLEVTDGSGKVSAESFRVMRPASIAAKSPETAAPAAPVKPSPVAHLIAPKATHRVPPVVPAGIRPRIHGSIPIDVRVNVDTRGRVTSAAPLKKHSGLEAFLAERAVAAARQWRFTPAIQDGKPVAGVQTIHFVFDR